MSDSNTSAEPVDEPDTEDSVAPPDVAKSPPSGKPAPAARAYRPGLRRRRVRIAAPTQQELDDLDVKVRLELLDKQRSSRHQTVNTVGIACTVLFTLASLVLSWLNLRSSHETQISEQYNKAVEQLGSTQKEVRLGAIYALERVARKSDHDRPAIVDELAAFIRDRSPAPTTKATELPTEPYSDIAAALTVVGNLPHSSDHSPDLHNIRTPFGRLNGANFSYANLAGAYLVRTEMWNADLTGADLTRADLTGAFMIGTKLRIAHLEGAILHSAHMFLANLSGATLERVDLAGADLRRANLAGADLSRVNLAGADLGGADLRGVTGISVQELQTVARVDASTRF